MLDTYIIEEIKRREEERRRKEESQRPSLEIPIYPPDADADTNPSARDDDAPQRGVIVIDYSL